MLFIHKVCLVLAWAAAALCYHVRKYLKIVLSLFTSKRQKCFFKSRMRSREECRGHIRRDLKRERERTGCMFLDISRRHADDVSTLIAFLHSEIRRVGSSEYTITTARSKGARRQSNRVLSSPSSPGAGREGKGRVEIVLDTSDFDSILHVDKVKEWTKYFSISTTQLSHIHISFAHSPISQQTFILTHTKNGTR